MHVHGVLLLPALQGKKGEEVEEVKEEKISSVFVPSIEAAVHEFVAKWQVRRGGRRQGGRHFQQGPDEGAVTGEGTDAFTQLCGALAQTALCNLAGSGPVVTCKLTPSHT